MLRYAQATVLAAAVLLMPVGSSAGIKEVARCQKKFASQGARFAQRVITATLKCSAEIAECQVQCEEGVFGPPCSSNPPPCCDPDDRNSNATFGECMDEADEECAKQDAKIDKFEIKKVEKITTACSPLTLDELCGSTGNGLNFETLNAGCLALDPSYVCSLTNLVECIGGPLERQLVDQISAILDPRLPSAIAAAGLQSSFPGVPVARKVQGDVAAGKVDVWAISGQAGAVIKARVLTRNDNGNGTASLAPDLILLGGDAATPVGETNVVSSSCSVPPACGASCPLATRTLPSSGTFHFAVGGVPALAGCPGGAYRLVVVSPDGAVPTLVFDDIDP